MEATLDPITDIFRTMHVTAFCLHRLEATAPWGHNTGEADRRKVTPADKKMSPSDLAHFAMLSRGALLTVQKALSLFNVFVDFTNRMVWCRSLRQGLGLAGSEARASACVSIYSLMCVTLPSRTVMSKTHSSLYGLFVA